LRWLAWPLRLVIAVGAARVLLHNTTYLEDLAGPDSREWTPAQTWKILAGMGAALAVVWAALVLLVRRAPGRSVPLAVALACAAAAVTVMHSGYASGGQVGLPLAAALAGAVAASLVLSGPPAMEGALGLAVVGLFALLVIGRFFGELTTLNAALLFFAPLLCWLPELPPRFRGVARVVMVAVPVAVALLLAHQKFAEDSARTAPGPQEPSTQDYLDIGK
ncbi:MAG TPA: hypothetical protein VG013_20065, partial [Gemmataceae bacterium]|nr:hypothetical protein [Gemmataceae bacterium]